MRRTAPTVALLAALLVPAAASAPVADARSAAVPSLRLAGTRPLVVRGRAFRPGERVRVSLLSPAVGARRTTTASRYGTFAVRFRTVVLGPCLGLRIRAVGSEGSVAVLRRLPLPGCMPE